MKKLPKISVVTPSFNQGQYIKETIDSVLSQKYPDLEYWIIDGGSTDETVSILKSYGNKIKWVSRKDNGQTYAINNGMNKVAGEVVCYLNSDDVFLPGTLLLVGELFAKNPSTLWVSGDYKIIDSHGDEIQSYIKWYKRFFRKLKTNWLLLILNFIIQPSTFWKKSIFKDIGYFDESLRYCMDYDFWLRLYDVSNPVILDQALSKFRIHAGSKGGSQYKKQFKEQLKVVQRHTTNSIFLTLHKLHSAATVLAYNMIK